MLVNCATSCHKYNSRPDGSFYDITEKDIHGKDVSFDRFRNKVVYVVNVASHCGYTASNYETFRILKKYIPWGLEILLFPCNQFGNQEPGSSADIISFAEQQQFEGMIMSKGDVTGANIRPTFKFLKSAVPGKEIEW